MSPFLVEEFRFRGKNVSVFPVETGFGQLPRFQWDVVNLRVPEAADLTFRKRWHSAWLIPPLLHAPVAPNHLGTEGWAHGVWKGS